MRTPVRPLLSALLVVIAALSFFFGLALGAEAAGQTPVFGPEKFTRSTGAPQRIVRTFTVQDTTGPFMLVVQNGEGKRGRISSAVVEVNGIRVLGPSDFNKQVEVVQRPIILSRQNTIAVEVRSQPNTFVVVTILGPHKEPVIAAQGIKLNPDVLFVGEPTMVAMKATLPYMADQGAPVVTLQRVDEAGHVIAVEGTLTDNGDLSNNDDVAGDGVFGLRKLFTAQGPGKIQLRLAVGQGADTLFSEVFVLSAFAHITPADLNAILQFQQAASQAYDNLIPSLGGAAARNSVLAQVRQSPLVERAAVIDGAFGISVVYKNGLRGLIEPLSLNTLGGGASAAGQLVASTGEGDGTFGSSFTAVTAPEAIKSKRAIVLTAVYAEAEGTLHTADIANTLQSLSCDPAGVLYLRDADFTVEVVKTLHKYGVISITSHGDTYYDGQWSTPYGEVTFRTGQQITDANYQTYEADMLAGRLVMMTGKAANGSCATYYAILPDFIRTYTSEPYPDSLVYLTACRSAFNTTMAYAFLDMGANSYLGYDEYVSLKYAGETAPQFFHNFVLDPSKQAVGLAAAPLPTQDCCWVGSALDWQTHLSHLRIHGSVDLTPPAPSLLEGSFETGGMGAWFTMGDARVLHQLGPFTPQDGYYMGIISTGLGYTTDSGMISQTLCVPANTTTLMFSWNFISEEFHEYCGSGFQDFFRVEVMSPNGVRRFERVIDDLCAEAQTAYPPGFDVGDAWSTGWRTDMLDITGLAGSGFVTVKFSVGDVGDSIYDTAVLLDAIQTVP